MITFGFVGKEVVNLADGAVVCNDGETFVVHVQDQILTLHILRMREDIGKARLTITARPIRPISPLDSVIENSW